MSTSPLAALVPVLLLAGLGLPGCGVRCPEVAALTGNATVLTLGDSLLRTQSPWCASIPDVVALERDEPGDNRSVGGAKVLEGPDAIPAQYEAGDWEWVILDGGGNDLVDVCDQEGEAARIDALVSPDRVTGAMAALVDRVVADGARVALVGYYPMRAGAWLGFDACDRAFERLNARYEALAAQRSGVLFVDLGDVIDPVSTPEAYLIDGVHPTLAGASRAGLYLAERMAEVEQAEGPVAAE